MYLMSVRSWKVRRQEVSPMQSFHKILMSEMSVRFSEILISQMSFERTFWRLSRHPDYLLRKRRTHSHKAPTLHFLSLRTTHASRLSRSSAKRVRECSRKEDERFSCLRTGFFLPLQIAAIQIGSAIVTGTSRAVTLR